MNNDELRQMIKENWEEVIENAEAAAGESNRDFDDITVLAVSKTHPVEIVVAGMEAGIPAFGENYAQELKEKHQYFIDNNIREPLWHFIGHLQTNKVKYIAPFVDMIHSVDSVKLAMEISKQAKKSERVIDILLQVNTSGELSKSGCEPDEVFKLAEQVLKIENLNVKGLMTIGSFSPDEEVVRSEFRILSSLRKELAEKYGEETFRHLSMGMTGDYPVAIDEGATFVRVGTAIFGARHYNK